MKKTSIVNIVITGLAIIFLACSCREQKQSEPRLTRDLNLDLMINQVGYVPESPKNVVARGSREGKFEVVNLETQKIAYKGKLKPFQGDFGEFSTGDFTRLTEEGRYYIRYDTLRSYPFTISKTAYRYPMSLIVGYFSLQRCGLSTTGYLSPCHLDDGVRLDNGTSRDVTGGWHDASDLRKWVSATIYGMIGLTHASELLPENDPDKDRLLDELRWGNQYFLKMQEKEGYVMNFIGGEVKQNWDNNRWTDNIIGKEGGELHFVKPVRGKSMNEMLIFGDKDDRIIQTDPVDISSQYNFITSEAIMTRLTSTKDPEYSKKCLAAAESCFEWCIKNEKEADAGILGSSIRAATELYKTTKSDEYMDFSVKRASLLKKLQISKSNEPVWGFYQTSAKDAEPYKQIWIGCMEFMSICDLALTFPDHANVPEWKSMISDYANGYLSNMSHKNSFGIVPYGLFAKENPGGGRKTGNYWYRYFMQPDRGWWVGINSNIASAGIGLLKASIILNDKKLMDIAQKQLDWIIGANPFNSSTIVTVGYNHPPQFFNGSEFRPATPVLPGAVMNGLGGDTEDQPSIGKGNYNISEYWTPMVAHTLWLMAEITNNATSESYKIINK